MIDDVMLEAEEKMEAALEAAKREMASIRTGRANPAMFNSIMVDYYGAPTPLQQLASLTIPEARTVIVSPFDRSAMKAITTAIRESDLGVNPTDDGTVIRVSLPALTEERRKDYVKLARNRAEDSRVQVRGIRGKSKKELEAIKKDGEAGEDEVKRAETELDALTKRFVEKIDAALSAKEAELLEV
ncbi:Ribosome-releasing factor [Actinomyces bovis]|uniref:Ribosome-recycling factor n=1 Tax=Actinomyces bovis TaxID=1658 RepID=A0ABY1VLU4_9ACTO|nr:ribosome recycling factor [Actinomyces bovis]SPT52641.1 Ribosome-releasing factor [Actinomyces bovis]VEG54525.1 Ribosome-releasing factor [Actinomyces israelii]